MFSRPFLLTLSDNSGFADDYLKVSKNNSKGLPGKLKLLGQLVTTICVIGLLLGPWGSCLNGTTTGMLESASKMREFWVPFTVIHRMRGHQFYLLYYCYPFFL